MSRLLPFLDDAPEGLALRFPEGELGFGELRTLALGLAEPLAGLSRVAIWAEPRLETAVALTAALCAGVPAVPLNPQSGDAELEHILRDSSPGAGLAPARAELPAALDIPRIEVPTDPSTSTPSIQSPAEPPPDSPALIVYTSGTTGPPKGVVMPRRAVATNLDALAEAWEWTREDVVVQALPLFHVHGLVIGVLGPLRLGGTSWHLGRFSPEAVAEALGADATMLFGVPTMYRRLARAAEDDRAVADGLADARLLVSGSAALPAAEHQRLEQLCGQSVVERYGMTETLMITAIRAGGGRAAGYVGPPLQGVDVRLVDDDGLAIEASDDDEIGEVQVRGPNLFLGYLNRPDSTAEAFDGEWFKTGDLATRRGDGYIRLLGRRATDLIKSGGFKIGAGEIEAALREHPAVEDAAVTGCPDDDLGEIVAAWVVLRDEQRVEPDELSVHVAKMLAPHKRPRRVEFVAELPRNALGKVQKSRLR